MDALWKDVRFALRMLRRTPGVAVAAVLALALGIGANTAIFSVVDGVLLRPLPFHDARALMLVNGKFPVQGLFDIGLSVPELHDVSQQSRTFSAVGAYASGESNLVGGVGAPDHVAVGLGSASLFPMLGVAPVIGRSFTTGEELKGSDQVALLDHGLWQRRFGGDTNIVGKTVQLDNLSYKIIGVLPAGFRIDGDTPCDLWIPLASNNPELTRGSHFLRVLGRLKPGTTRAQLDADLAAISARLVEQYAQNYRGGSWSLEAKPFQDVIVGNARLALWVLFGAVAFVLLIACANVANLLLARAAARGREMAIRTALGAARVRLIRQMLTESILLALAGGGLGLLLAEWGVDAMLALAPDALPRASEVAVDGRVLAFTVGAALVTGVVFGLMPALSASRPDLTWALKDGSRGATASRGRLRRALVVAEVALSLILLVGTGLMVQSFVRLRNVDPGFHPDHVLAMSVVRRGEHDAPGGVDEPPPSDDFYERATRELARLPGVRAAGAATLLPLDGNSSDFGFEIENWVPRVAGDNPDAQAREIAGDYFAALGVPLVRGRLFAPSDDASSPPVVVVNQAFARRWWPNEDALGKHLRIKNRRAPKPWATVVGVVGDTRDFGLDQPPKPEMFFAHAQERRFTALTLVVRTVGAPMAMANAARGVIAEIDPEQPIFNVQTMDDYVAHSLAQRRFSLVLMLIFAGVALLLAAVGIYGVMSYTVAQRTQEIGIRVALGASESMVLKMVVADGMRLVAIGLLLGLAGAFALTRLLASMLYGVSPTDAPTFAAIAAVLALVALAATVIPARRAMRVDPMLALRAD